ncbi:MAG: DUF448 domain-containing protein [Lactobacillales bacterium]|nr:DUF448 domain-containing protein [Lactobacillales bacterium]
MKATAQPNKQKEVSEKERMCFICRKTFSASQMLRFVVSPTGEVFFDVKGNLPGRGMWLFPARETVQKAIQGKMFSKAAKEPAAVPADLMDIIESQLKERIFSLLGLARKSGKLTSGFENVKKAVAKGNVALLVEADDASVREQGKLFRPTDNFDVYKIFTREELGAVMGADVQVHIAVFNGAVAEELKELLKKLSLFQGLCKEERVNE